MTRKIERMHELFGRDDEHKCKDCYHLQGGQNQYRKCEIYGHSASEATDWALRWTACGLFNREYRGDVSIVRLQRTERKEEQIEGQMSLTFGG